MMYSHRGFSLIELLVALAILCSLLGLGLFVSLDTYRGYIFRSDENTIVNILERARSLAMSNSYQSPWGVCYLTGDKKYVLFSGSTYAAGNPQNEMLQADARVSISGLPNCASGGIIFTQLSGTTTPRTISVTQNNRTSLISINYEGRINW